MKGFWIFQKPFSLRCLRRFDDDKPFQKRKAIQYVIGNPLIALQVTQHDIRASLYAPLRVLLYEDERGRTCLEYDKPSSLFGQFNDERIAPVASMLDRKLEARIATAVEERRFVVRPEPVRPDRQPLPSSLKNRKRRT